MLNKVKFLYISSILIICVLGITLIIDLLKIDDIQKNQRRDNKLSVTWILHQVDREARVFLQHVSYFYMGDPNVSKRQVSIKLDILWSRFSDKSNGRMEKLLAPVNKGEQLLQESKDILAQLDRIIDKIQPNDLETYNQVTQLTESLLKRFYDLSINSIFMQETLSEQRQKSISDLYRHLLITLFTLLFAIAVIIGLISVRGQTFKRKNEIFEQRVKDRTNELNQTNQSLVKEVEIRIESQRKSQQLISAIDKSKEIIFILDDDNHFVFFNKSFLHANQKVGDKLYVGSAYQEYLEAVAGVEYHIPSLSEKDLWINNRLQSLRSGSEPYEVTKVNGQQYIFNRNYLDDGTVIVIGSDITALKETQVALQKSENRFKDFALIGADWFWEMGTNGQFSYFAGRVEEAMETSRATLFGKSCRDLYTFNDINNAELDRFEKAFIDKTAFTDVLFKWVKVESSLVYLSLSGKPNYDENECFIGFRGVGRDVTQRYLVEQQDRRLIEAINSLSLIITIFDAEDKLTFFNKQFLLFNHEIAEHVEIGITFEELWRLSSDNQRAKYGDYGAEWYEKRLEMHRNPLEAFVMPWGDGCYMHICEQRLEGGGSIIVATDISETKKSEEKIWQLQNYLANIIDSMPSILIGVNSACDVSQWNRAAEVETGILLEDALNKPLIDVFPRLANHLVKVQQAIETKKEECCSKQVFMKDSKEEYEDIKIYPLVSNQNTGAVIRLDNVTEQVLVSEMIIQSEKMLSVGGLAAGMAHEINNPLAGMMQTANVMLNRLTNHSLQANVDAADEQGVSMTAVERYMDSRGIVRMVSNIIESSERIANIVENMLSFSRQNNVITSKYNLVNLMEKSVELAATDNSLRDRFNFRFIKIVKDYPREGVEIYCDAAKIQQVFLNILRNGAEAMQEANTQFPVFNIRIRREPNVHEAIIEIENNGPALDDDTKRRLFEPFFTTKPEGKGTGLGLSVSYFIIKETHGGNMSVESTDKAGCKFLIRLPLTNVNSEAQ